MDSCSKCCCGRIPISWFYFTTDQLFMLTFPCYMITRSSYSRFLSSCRRWMSSTGIDYPLRLVLLVQDTLHVLRPSSSSLRCGELANFASVFRNRRRRALAKPVRHSVSVGWLFAGGTTGDCRQVARRQIPTGTELYLTRPGMGAVPSPHAAVRFWHERSCTPEASVNTKRGANVICGLYSLHLG